MANLPREREQSEKKRLRTSRRQQRIESRGTKKIGALVLLLYELYEVI